MSAAQWEPDDQGPGPIGPRHGAGERRDGPSPIPPPGSLASSSAGEQAAGRPGPRRRPRERSRVRERGSEGQDVRPSPARAALGVLSEMVVVLSLAMILSLVIKTFLVQAFFIPSQSMEQTLRIGDRVVVSKLTPGPFDLDRGDVVVFKDPGGWLEPVPVVSEQGLRHVVREVMTFVGLLPQDSGEHLIKRVIGLPGDTLTCCDDAGRLVIDSVPVDEPYLYPGDEPSDTTFSVTVPAGHLWVMGDHRSISKDSRFNEMQFVPIEDVVGQAFVVVWPLDRLAGLGVPDSVFGSVPAGGS